MFHFTARVNWRSWHLDDNPTKLLLAELLREAAESFGVRILAWVFISNHIHAVVPCPPAGLYRQLTSRSTASRHLRPWTNGHAKCSVLAQFMRRLRHRMSILRQRQLDLTGRFWESSYDARLITGGLSLAIRIAYDHRNPVKAGMVARPEDYRWSSASQWATGVDGVVPVSIADPVPFHRSAEALRETVLRYQQPATLDAHSAELKRVFLGPSESAEEELRRLLAQHDLL